jgi:hypothetical protein
MFAAGFNFALGAIAAVVALVIAGFLLLFGIAAISALWAHILPALGVLCGLILAGLWIWLTLTPAGIEYRRRRS